MHSFNAKHDYKHLFLFILPEGFSLSFFLPSARGYSSTQYSAYDGIVGLTRVLIWYCSFSQLAGLLHPSSRSHSMYEQCRRHQKPYSHRLDHSRISLKDVSKCIVYIYDEVGLKRKSHLHLIYLPASTGAFGCQLTSRTHDCQSCLSISLIRILLTKTTTTTKEHNKPTESYYGGRQLGYSGLSENCTWTLRHPLFPQALRQGYRYIPYHRGYQYTRIVN